MRVVNIKDATGHHTVTDPFWLDLPFGWLLWFGKDETGRRRGMLAKPTYDRRFPPHDPNLGICTTLGCSLPPEHPAHDIRYWG